RESETLADRERDHERSSVGVGYRLGETLRRGAPHAEPPARKARRPGLDPLAGAHVARRAEIVHEEPLLVVEPARIREPARRAQPHGQRETLPGAKRCRRVVPAETQPLRNARILRLLDDERERHALRSEERRVGKSVTPGARQITQRK